MKAIYILLLAALLVGCETAKTGQPGFSPGYGSGFDVIPENSSEKAEATFTGGDGSSINQAVIITEAAGEKTGVRAEYVWLHEHYPGYRLTFQSLQHENGKNYDHMKVVTVDGKKRSVFFDITSFFGKY